MENFSNPLPQTNKEELSVPSTEAIIYPPKYKKQDQTSNIWLKSFISLAVYLVLGYYIFPSYKILLLITAFYCTHTLS